LVVCSFMSGFWVYSGRVRTLGGPTTAKNNIIQYIKSQAIDILCLQEVNVQMYNTLTNWIKFSEIGDTYNIYSDHNDKLNVYNCNGTAIILRKSLSIYIKQYYAFSTRFTGLLLKNKKINIFIGNIYYPSNPNKNTNTLLDSHKLDSYIKKSDMFSPFLLII
jgi:exonuclease III